MPELARKYSTRRYSNYNEISAVNEVHSRVNAYSSLQNNFARQDYIRSANRTAAPVRPFPHKKTADKTKVNINNFISRCLAIFVTVLIGVFILPFGFEKVTKAIFIKTPYKEVTTDFHQLRFPTSGYLANNWFLGERSLKGAVTKKPAMMNINETYRMTGLENELKNLNTLYPSIHPAVYVWDYENGSFADINADEIFSAASIIKVPVLIQLFRSIEQNQLTIYDEMKLTDFYRAEGSGSLQFKAEGAVYTINDLARLMITESDNSATNMLMSKLGSMVDINEGIRDWGLKKTYVQTWLPDLQGTNHTTARDMAKMFYNIDDNPAFLSVSSRERIFDYMGHVHNDRLIPAGLGAGASFLHKTGDIGKMLGDSGIVFAPNGKKYIVVILANRPYNSPAGKEYIVKASDIIYRYMVK